MVAAVAEREHRCPHRRRQRHRRRRRRRSARWRRHPERARAGSRCAARDCANAHRWRRPACPLPSPRRPGRTEQRRNPGRRHRRTGRRRLHRRAAIPPRRDGARIPVATSARPRTGRLARMAARQHLAAPKRSRRQGRRRHPRRQTEGSNAHRRRQAQTQQPDRRRNPADTPRAQQTMLAAARRRGAAKRGVPQHNRARRRDRDPHRLRCSAAPDRRRARGVQPVDAPTGPRPRLRHLCSRRRQPRRELRPDLA